MSDPGHDPDYEAMWKGLRLVNDIWFEKCPNDSVRALKAYMDVLERDYTPHYAGEGN